MENDLISRSALKEDIACHKLWTDQEYETDRQWALGYNAGIDRALFSITHARAVDAEVVRRGEWMPYKQNVECSECHVKWAVDKSISVVYTSIKDLKYCPNCGAKMDAEVEGCTENA